MDKYIIGITSHYHDSSACLFKNDELLFAAEEERFTGVKHDSSFPHNTVNYIFDKYEIGPDDIDTVCYYDDVRLKFQRVKSQIKKIWYKSPLLSLKWYIGGKRKIKEIHNELSKISKSVVYTNHHDSHIIYSYSTSPFDTCDMISLDGVGEWDTCVFRKDFNSKNQIGKYPHSIGLFYSTITSYLGFRPNSGEYKVMGLSSYGEPTYLEKLKSLICYDIIDNKLTVNMNYFEWDKTDGLMYNEKLVKYLKLEPRLPEEEITQEHKNLSKSLQRLYEILILDILRNNSSDNEYLCIGGGCGYNGLMNTSILEKLHYKKIWIPSSPSDSGSSIGACLLYMYSCTDTINKITNSPFLGPEPNNNIISRKKTEFDTKDELNRYVAQRIHEGDVVGWVQSKMEFGARALGNRSILANPLQSGTRNRINQIVKKRENFRPFAPMVIKEEQDIFFHINDDIPYMNQIVQCREEYIDKLTEVVHIDGTSRVQTVYKDNSTYGLLLEFKKLSGYPILLNTSFNIKDQPIVLDAQKSYDTFKSSDIDLLVVENTVYYK